MIFKAFTTLDTKTGAFRPPFFVAHVGQALRMATDAAQDMGTELGRHPGDFVLCQVGSYDDNTGMLTPQMPESICTLASLIPTRSDPNLFDQAIRTVDESHVGPNGRS